MYSTSRQIFLIGFSALLASSPARAELRVVGTDLLGVEFSQSLYAFAGRQRLQLALAFDGSRPGLDALKAGRADLALLVLPAEEETLPAEFDSLVIGYHCVVVLAPAACPLERISVPQLAAIFGAGGSPGLTRWGELGGEGDWAAAVISPTVPEMGAGIAVEYFRHSVLHGRGLRANVARYQSPTKLAELFAGESHVLALTAAPAAPGHAKIIPIAAGAKAPAFLPSAENVHAGHYALRLPLRAVFRRDAAPRLRGLLRFLVDDGTATQIERAGLVPLPAAARAQQPFAPGEK